MLSLPDVTLVCIYNNCHELTLLAADDCTRHIQFGDVKLFTDQAFGRDVILMPPFEDRSKMSEFVWYELPKFISTSHALFFQWDGWVINPGAWDARFLEYDYVGAPWWYKDDYNVGNGGFSLWSKHLMDFLAVNKEQYPIPEPHLGLPEDHTLCRIYRQDLEPQFKWAPQELAWHFAVERTALYPLDQVFGFHGLFNFARMLSGDRLKERLRLIENNPWSKAKIEYQELVQQLAA